MPFLDILGDARLGSCYFQSRGDGEMVRLEEASPVIEY